jgi:hypothetical protein
VTELATMGGRKGRKREAAGKQINGEGGRESSVAAARHAAPATKQMERSRRGWK